MMHSNFDAYHQWLSIPPKAQPPDHYRLLGVTRFETNAEVISRAAEKRLEYLRTFQTGAEAKECERLRGEVEHARATLLEPHRKTVYDALLRAATSAGEAGRWAEPGKAGFLSVGQSIGRFKVLAVIRETALATTCTVEDPTAGRVYSLKMLSRQAAADDRLRKRFDREVEISRRLNHPNLVTGCEAGAYGKIPYLVTEYVLGTDLQTLVEQCGPFPPDQAIELAEQAACGLGQLHLLGVHHRNVSPRNLLLDIQGRVRVSNLLLAGIEEGSDLDGDDNLTRTGEAMGSSDFMAPEQVVDASAADQRADIYSLGCTLFYLLTGRVPYGGRGAMEKALAHRNSPIPSLQDHCPDAPAWLDRVFQKMVAKQPKDRYQSMAEVSKALGKTSTGTAMSQGWLAVAGRRPVVLAMVGSLATVVGILFVALVMRGGGTAAPSASRGIAENDVATHVELGSPEPLPKVRNQDARNGESRQQTEPTSPSPAVPTMEATELPLPKQDTVPRSAPGQEAARPSTTSDPITRPKSLVTTAEATAASNSQTTEMPMPGLSGPTEMSTSNSAADATPVAPRTQGPVATPVKVAPTPMTGEIHVACNDSNASDNNDGTPGRPLKTVAAAARRAQPGNIVTIRGGTYRETVARNNLRGDAEHVTVFRAAPGEEVVFEGADPFTNWQLARGRIWNTAWPHHLGNAPRPSNWPDGAWAYPMWRKEAVFVDGCPLRPVPGPDALAPGSFCVDEERRELSVWLPDGSDPNSHAVIASVRGPLWQFQESSHVRLEGLTFQHSASPSQGLAAVLFPTCEAIWIVECRVQWNGGTGIFLMGSDFRLENTVANFNGSQGVEGNTLRNCRFRNNEMSYNNWRSALGGVFGWAFAGLKIGNGTENRIEGHVAVNNLTHGIWFDFNHRGNVIDGALVHGNWGRGVFLEAGIGTNHLTNSLISHTRGIGHGVNVANSPGQRIWHNIFWENGTCGVNVGGSREPRGTTPNNSLATDCEVRENVFVGAGSEAAISLALLDHLEQKNYVISTFHAIGNKYFDDRRNDVFSVAGKRLSPGQWQGRGWDTTGAWEKTPIPPDKLKLIRRYAPVDEMPLLVGGRPCLPRLWQVSLARQHTADVVLKPLTTWGENVWLATGTNADRTIAVLLNPAPWPVEAKLQLFSGPVKDRLTAKELNPSGKQLTLPLQPYQIVILEGTAASPPRASGRIPAIVPIQLRRQLTSLQSLPGSKTNMAQIRAAIEAALNARRYVVAWEELQAAIVPGVKTAELERLLSEGRL